MEQEYQEPNYPTKEQNNAGSRFTVSAIPVSVYYYGECQPHCHVGL